MKGFVYEIVKKSSFLSFSYSLSSHTNIKRMQIKATSTHSFINNLLNLTSFLAHINEMHYLFMILFLYFSTQNNIQEDEFIQKLIERNERT